MAQTSSHTARRRRPAALKRAASSTVEMLEVRRMMSTVVNKDASGDNDGLGDYFVTGTSGTDKITIYLDPQDNFFAIHDDKNGNGQVNSGELTTGEFPETIDVSTLGGTDTVNVLLLSDLQGQPELDPMWNAAPNAQANIPIGGYYHEGISIYVDLGSGNDKFEIKSPTQPLSNNIHNALSAAAGFDVDSDEDGADIIEGGDLLVQADGGNDKDTINFDFSRTSVVCSSLIATSDAGSGDDIVNLTLPNFVGDGSGDSIEPQEGIVGCFDYYTEGTVGTVSAQGLGNYYGEGVTPSTVSVAIDLGSGKNTLNINTNTLVSASDVHIEVDGGKDTDIINDNESILATSFVIPLGESRRGIESDIPGRYVVDVELGSGNDTYNQIVDFSGLELEPQPEPGIGATALGVDFNGEVTYNVRGDSGKDTIKVKDLDNGDGPDDNTALVFGALTYNLYGGNDDDNVQFDTNPGSQFEMDGGTLNVLVSCDGGNDFGRIDLALVIGGDVLQGKLADPAILTLSGGSGNDKLGMMVEVVTPVSVTPVTTKGVFLITPPGFFGPRGYPMLDGGAGSDKYDTEGNVVIVTRGAETNDESIEPAYVP